MAKKCGSCGKYHSHRVEEYTTSYMSLLQKGKLPKACFSMNVASLSVCVPHLLAR